ncbi:MAG: molybdenum cofactor biosynthesis protein MoaE [Planctomycetes bacterium]|nr:molybdenum cofactor biosynthesis protein MoaE [Planctomycetota bacterium]
MDVCVRLFAGLRERAGTDRVVVTALREGATVGELKAALAARHPELGSLVHVAGVVGTAYAHDQRALAPGEEVALLPPVSGGSGADEDRALELGVFELARTALDPAVLEARVRHPSCGAVLCFTGTTRAVNQGRDVARLEYEAFEAMTGPEMERIFARCRAEALGGERARLLVVHRVGVVEVGEPSVVIAVASAHRAAAFAASRFLIDALKQTLPIWKKEVYADGHTWIGERS